MRSRRCPRSYSRLGCCSVVPSGHDFATFGERGYVASPPLHQVLEKTRQGETVKISKDLTIRPRSTFETRQGTRCREIDVIFPNRMETAALACRGSDGAWRVPVIPTPPIATYETAGGKQDGKQDKPQQSGPRGGMRVRRCWREQSAKSARAKSRRRNETNPIKKVGRSGAERFWRGCDVAARQIRREP